MVLFFKTDVALSRMKDLLVDKVREHHSTDNIYNIKSADYC